MDKPQKKANPNPHNNNNAWVPVEPPPQVEPLTPEWACLKFLSDWTAEDIALAIKKDFEIDLAPFWTYVENIVIKEVLNWFRTYRPDLHGILATERGIEWLKKNIRKIATQM
ncbi:MAG: hypothetical protein ACK419_06180 [Pyrinomonadaceae bacterium]